MRTVKETDVPGQKSSDVRRELESAEQTLAECDRHIASARAAVRRALEAVDGARINKLGRANG